MYRVCISIAKTLISNSARKKIYLSVPHPPLVLPPPYSGQLRGRRRCRGSGRRRRRHGARPPTTPARAVAAAGPPACRLPHVAGRVRAIPRHAAARTRAAWPHWSSSRVAPTPAGAVLVGTAAPPPCARRRRGPPCALCHAVLRAAHRRPASACRRPSAQAAAQPSAAAVPQLRDPRAAGGSRGRGVRVRGRGGGGRG
ncbi:hypothetical protein PVAP13_1NG128920 [Panicum virgatum]|uniref:Uncharacterized protein n=1 Tax=Panicum virgatum TaxID=38727 RepID=A0A8T0WJH8_PANVG|nr:hypothetical protein PVAP13_1NG128920 [Panicum virgatum]